MTPVLLLAALTARDPCGAATEHFRAEVVSALDIAEEPVTATCSKPSRSRGEVSLTLDTHHIRITRDGGHERVTTRTAYRLAKAGRSWEVLSAEAPAPRRERYLPGASIPAGTASLTGDLRLAPAEHAVSIPGSWLIWSPQSVPQQAYDLGTTVCRAGATWPEGAVAKGAWRGTVFPGERTMLLELTPDGIWFAGEPVMALSGGLPYADQVSGRRFIPLFEQVSTARRGQEELSARLNGCLGPERGQIAVAVDVDIPMTTVMGALTTLHFAGIEDAFLVVDDPNPQEASAWVPAEARADEQRVEVEGASTLAEGDARQVLLLVDETRSWARTSAGLDQAWRSRPTCARLASRVSRDLVTMAGQAPELTGHRPMSPALTATLAVLPVHLEQFDGTLDTGSPPMCK